MTLEVEGSVGIFVRVLIHLALPRLDRLARTPPEKAVTDDRRARRPPAHAGGSGESEC